MSESASIREVRRQRTSRRITVRAQELADAHGLDGFTMDDLAEAAEVSRRTLFNYFPGKLDAVLGAVPTLLPEVVDRFLRGGPHGHLVDDLAELAVELLSVDGLTRAELDLGQRVFLAEPRLLVAAHQRFAGLTAQFAELILEREGREFGADRAQLLIRLLVSLFDACLPVLPGEAGTGGDVATLIGSAPPHPDDDRPLAEVYVETLRTARDLLA